MIAKFMTVLSFLLIFSMIGCGDSSSLLKPETQPAVSPVVFEDVLISENIRATPAVSVDTVAQPLPLKQEEVAAAPVLIAVVAAVSCGAAAFEVGTLALGTPDFLANHMLFVGMAAIPCPADKVIKVIKGIRILKSLNTLGKAKFKNFIPRHYRDNFEILIGRGVRSNHDVHHAIPQKHRAQAGKHGINIDQPWHLIEIRKDYHQFITPNYRKDWEKFFDLPNLNRSEILDYEQSMLNKYGLKSGSYLDLIK